MGSAASMKKREIEHVGEETEANTTRNAKLARVFDLPRIGTEEIRDNLLAILPADDGRRKRVVCFDDEGYDEVVFSRREAPAFVACKAQSSRMLSTSL
mmetsp:Transcript_15559/g.42225  ORF Transcript_15559/g.42225 Transcript_15559/m.42225 type:complete len:98 (+) Transcript_15559:44-337(+)